jgi:hypothetical protein
VNAAEPLSVKVPVFPRPTTIWELLSEVPFEAYTAVEAERFTLEPEGVIVTEESVDVIEIAPLVKPFSEDTGNDVDPVPPFAWDKTPVNDMSGFDPPLEDSGELAVTEDTPKPPPPTGVQSVPLVPPGDVFTYTEPSEYER